MGNNKYSPLINKGIQLAQTKTYLNLKRNLANWLTFYQIREKLKSQYLSLQRKKMKGKVKTRTRKPPIIQVSIEGAYKIPYSLKKVSNSFEKILIYFFLFDK